MSEQSPDKATRINEPQSLAELIHLISSLLPEG